MLASLWKAFDSWQPSAAVVLFCETAELRLDQNPSGTMLPHAGARSASRPGGSCGWDDDSLVRWRFGLEDYVAANLAGPALTPAPGREPPWGALTRQSGTRVSAVDLFAGSSEV